MSELERNSHGPLPMASGAIFAGVSAVVLLGSITMLMGKLHWLGVTASILAMINLVNCCCLLGLPFGIWALVVLLRPDVREAFS